MLLSLPSNERALSRQRALMNPMARFSFLVRSMTPRLPHGRRELPSLPKLVGRFLITAPRFAGVIKLLDATRAVWLGSARGRPAGAPAFRVAFRERYIPSF